MLLHRKYIALIICLLCSYSVCVPTTVNAAYLSLMITIARGAFEIVGNCFTAVELKKLINGDSIGKEDITKLERELSEMKQAKSNLNKNGELSFSDSEKVDRAIYFFEKATSEADRKILSLEEEARKNNSDIRKLRITIKDLKSIESDIRKLSSRIDTLECDQSLVGDASYQGECKNGLPHGYGVMSFPDGQRYKGSFKEGLRNGQGTHFFPDGERIEGVWVEGQIR